MSDCPDWVVAATIATEVPPVPQGVFTADMIPRARRAVAEVIRNRHTSGRFQPTPAEVVLAPRQFSAVCREDYWRRAVAGTWQPRHVMRSLDAWYAAVTDPTGDLADGATHYYSPISMVPKWSAPGWIQGMTEVRIPGISRDFFRWYK